MIAYSHIALDFIDEMRSYSASGQLEMTTHLTHLLFGIHIAPHLYWSRSLKIWHRVHAVRRLISFCGELCLDVEVLLVCHVGLAKAPKLASNKMPTYLSWSARPS